MRKLGVIGGSGLYELPGIQDVREVSLETPFGAPSDAFVTGRLGDTELVFVPRHGRGHRFTPTEVNYRANVWGLKMLGVERVLAISAVGSMKEAVAPGHLVIVDQYVDRTHARQRSFFGDGVVAHVSFASPCCEELRKVAVESSRAAGAVTHASGTYLCIEGPQFSTRAESLLYRSWGVDVIGMTTATEARLCREAELCFGAVALATDYDCWNEAHAEVSVEAVVATVNANVGRARALIVELAKRLPDARACRCGSSLDHAIMTAPSAIPAKARAKLDLLVGKYLPKAEKPARAKKPAAKPAQKKKKPARR